ncbi:Uncharacterized protein Rs2_04997 [Raphanus sativus]|nr:Uncharacterized protein Rs2_04997 [Raphanus sativus]
MSNIYVPSQVELIKGFKVTGMASLPSRAPPPSVRLGLGLGLFFLLFTNSIFSSSSTFSSALLLNLNLSPFAQSPFKPTFVSCCRGDQDDFMTEFHPLSSSFVKKSENKYTRRRWWCDGRSTPEVVS